jgi:hypothetical protein
VDDRSGVPPARIAQARIEKRARAQRVGRHMRITSRVFLPFVMVKRGPTLLDDGKGEDPVYVTLRRD